MANLSFFGSTVDAIAPQEQNVLSQYRQHNWQVEQANAAAAERARALSMEAFDRAQQEEQHRGQQEYVNRVNLLQFAERARGQRVAEGLAAQQVRNEPLEQTYQDAERMAEYATPETLDKFFGATLPKSRLNILKEFAGTRSKAVEKETAAQKLDLIFQITSKASKGELQFPVAEVATMFGLPEAEVKPAWERGRKMFTDTMIQKLNAATAKAKIQATNAFDKKARLSPDLTPDELQQVRLSFAGIPPAVSYDKTTGWSIKTPSENFSPVMGDVRRSEDNLDLSRFASPSRTATSPSTPAFRIPTAFGVAGQTPRVDLSQFRTGTNAPVIAPPVNLTPAPLNPTQRSVGVVYQTPAGPKRWQGRGWSNP